MEATEISKTFDFMFLQGGFMESIWEIPKLIVVVATKKMDI